MAAKYTDAEVKALGAKGHAFKNPDGSFSYPIGDAEDLGNAIKAVGRGGADHDAIRKYVIGRAKALGESSQIPDTWNADGSLSGSSGLDRGRFEQRRRRWAGSLLRQPARRSIRLARGCVEMRAKPDGSGGTNFEFRGYGSTFGEPFEMWDPWGDPFAEEVRAGAFSECLARADLDVPFLIGHNDAGIPMARTRNGTMRLSQDSRGLPVEAELSGRRSDVRDLADAVERGDMDEMSIGFVTLGQEWSPDWSHRYMTNLDLHRGDVSVVALAANPATRGSTMTPLPVNEAVMSGRQLEYRTPTQPYTAHPGETNECIQCHSVNDDTARFCDQCGTAMQPKGYASNMAGVEDMTQQCGSCSCWCCADAKYCGQCGHELAGDQGAGWDLWKDARPVEQRAQDEIIDPGGPPDSNIAANGLDAVKCPYTNANGCGIMNPGGNKFCGSCGGPLYQSDGTLVLDDSGVIEAHESTGDAYLLSMRLRLLELT